MNKIEQGYVLSIDQASKCAGVSLWYNGALQATTTLVAHTDTKYSRRVQQQAEQLNKFLDTQLPATINIEKIVFESVRMKLVIITVGAFLTCPRIDAKMHETASFIPSMSWKKWALDRGATGPFKEIKGVRALKEAGYPVDEVNPLNDDIADSIMMYQVWKNRR